MKIEEAKIYLARMERDRAKNEYYNKRSYQDAKKLAAWVSVAEYGNEQAVKRAMKIIKSI